jgi:hypothetical protein
LMKRARATRIAPAAARVQAAGRPCADSDA